MYFDPAQRQQSGNVFAWIDELQASIPGMTRWILAVVGSISGFFFASTHGIEEYTVLLVALGFFVGLLIIPVIAFALKALLALIIVAAIGLVAYELFQYQTTHHHNQGPPPSPITAIRHHI